MSSSGFSLGQPTVICTLAHAPVKGLPTSAGLSSVILPPWPGTLPTLLCQSCQNSAVTGQVQTSHFLDHRHQAYFIRSSHMRPFLLVFIVLLLTVKNPTQLQRPEPVPPLPQSQLPTPGTSSKHSISDTSHGFFTHKRRKHPCAVAAISLALSALPLPLWPAELKFLKGQGQCDILSLILPLVFWLLWGQGPFSDFLGRTSSVLSCQSPAVGQGSSSARVG